MTTDNRTNEPNQNETKSGQEFCFTEAQVKAASKAHRKHGKGDEYAGIVCRECDEYFEDRAGFEAHRMRAALVAAAGAAPQEPREQAWLVLLMPDSGAHKTREWRGVSASEDDAIERAMTENPGWSVHTLGPDVNATSKPRACLCAFHPEDRGGGYSELVLEPEPHCPEHGAGIVAAEVEVPADNGKCGGCRDLGPHRDVPGCEYYRARMRENDEKLRQLIADLVGEDDCYFDHHGGCQAHGCISLKPGEMCPHQEAKEWQEVWLSGVKAEAAMEALMAAAMTSQAAMFQKSIDLESGRYDTPSIDVQRWLIRFGETYTKENHEEG